MMQKAFKSMKLDQMQARAFSYNYSSPSHPRVWMDVEKDGEKAGRFVFEMYENHSPALVENFAAFATGNTDGQRSFVGSSICCSQVGLGVTCGHIDA